MDQVQELYFGILCGAERGTRTVQSGHIHTRFITTNALPTLDLTMINVLAFKPSVVSVFA